MSRSKTGVAERGISPCGGEDLVRRTSLCGSEDYLRSGEKTSSYNTMPTTAQGDLRAGWEKMARARRVILSKWDDLRAGGEDMSSLKRGRLPSG